LSVEWNDANDVAYGELLRDRRFYSHETSIFNRPHGYHKIFCVKKPIDILNTRALLAIDSHYGGTLDV
ncbi:MAG TPA: hypothetical protein VHJ19_03665, partial [Gammaproteobacteria bacterium]|nr:hypothetical protein [Gammaproteobacteria bacterium]